MTLLDFARGPALYWSVLILIGGLVWRLSGVLFLPFQRNLATPRGGGIEPVYGAISTIFSRMLPHREFWHRTAVGGMLGYAFHIGLLVIVVGGAAHVAVIKSATGLSWTPLPKGIIALVSGMTFTVLIIVLIRRLMHPVLRLLSNFDDYASLVLTIFPVLTGILLAGETFGSFGLLLAIHILSVTALMIWLPFGKLAHTVFVFFGRGALGANFARKGAAK
jgi:nitrate reductase gamma subunit